MGSEGCKEVGGDKVSFLFIGTRACGKYIQQRQRQFMSRICIMHPTALVLYAPRRRQLHYIGYIIHQKK